MSLKHWIHGLIGYVATGAATSVGGIIGALQFTPHLVWNREFWATLGGAAIFGGITGAVLYLKQSPIKPKV